MPETNTANLRILRINEVRQRLGDVSRSWLYDKLSPKSPRHDPSFPQLIRLGPRTVGILEEDLNAWIAARVTKMTGIENLKYSVKPIASKSH